MVAKSLLEDFVEKIVFSLIKIYITFLSKDKGFFPIGISFAMKK
jgi:hypothetical protein